MRRCEDGDPRQLRRRHTGEQRRRCGSQQLRTLVLSCPSVLWAEVACSGRGRAASQGNLSRPAAPTTKKETLAAKPSNARGDCCALAGSSYSASSILQNSRSAGAGAGTKGAGAQCVAVGGKAVQSPNDCQRTSPPTPAMRVGWRATSLCSCQMLPCSPIPAQLLPLLTPPDAAG